MFRRFGKWVEVRQFAESDHALYVGIAVAVVVAMVLFARSRRRR
jgi:hypothetical protein